MKAKINGIDLAYIDEGQGIPLLLVHGYPLSNAMWEPQVEALSKEFRVIAPDLRGHGETEAPAGPYTMELMADDLKGLLDHLNIDQAVIGGFSMGGYITFAFYRKYRERVRGLILADTRPQPDTPEARQGRTNSAELARREGAGAIADQMLPRLLSQDALQSKPQLAQKVRQIMASNSVNGIVGDLMALAERPDSVPLLPEIHCPTLIIVGEQDALTPVADSHLMAERIPNARLEILPKAGHLSNLEQPELFNQAVGSFLASFAPK